MSETLRFAWGVSSLGDFIIARSDKGLVALEFINNRADARQALRDRFPEADILEGGAVLRDVLDRARQVIESRDGAHDMALDPRGTPYELQVWAMLREIPAGETTTYGAMAAKLGSRDARDITAAIANNHLAVLVPCHRVIKKDGSISGYRWGFQRKRALLQREQIGVSGSLL